ncbi:MAG TPA: hypothetical protein VMH01_09695 [Puia sp.]|nr:hypothetical protein [Puia sp.]
MKLLGGRNSKDSGVFLHSVNANIDIAKQGLPRIRKSKTNRICKIIMTQIFFIDSQQEIIGTKYIIDRFNLFFPFRKNISYKIFKALTIP